MNTPLGKQTLALARGADYAHPGEEEAIVIAFKDVLPDSQRRILDAGCGPGGTADCVQQKGYGIVTGIDIDDTTLQKAAQKYPRCSFLNCDVEDVPDYFGQEFGLVYMFTSFYAFADQQKALTALRTVSVRGASLLLFDYCLGESPRGIQSIRREEAGRFNPVDRNGIAGMMECSGWKLSRFDDLSEKFQVWYDNLIQSVQKHKTEICNLGGEEWFQFVISFYSNMLKAISEGDLGGCLVSAVAF